MTKSYRQGQILKLIRGKRIGTQDELAQELKNLGIAATQVTLSRDIRDLRLVKTREGYQEMAEEEHGPQFEMLAAGMQGLHQTGPKNLEDVRAGVAALDKKLPGLRART